jgi:hypothetical protein
VARNLSPVAFTSGPRQLDLDRPVSEVGELLENAALNRAPNTVIAHPFWPQEEIDPVRWNRTYPYQLLVVEAKKDPGGEDGVSWQAVADWQFTFPLSLEALTESNRVATTTTVTQGGIIEESNGVPLRQFKLRGTFGVLAARGRAPQQQTPDVAQALAGGTIQALGGVQDALNALSQSLSGIPPVNPNTYDPAEFDTTETGASLVSKTSGYFQYHKLRQFIETYSELRRRREGRNMRLAFANWKDKTVYLVSINGWDTPRSSQSPLEYPFELGLLAFRRVKLEKGGFLATLPKPVRRDPGALARIVTTVSNARKVVQGLSKAAAAAVGDIERLILEPLREVVLFAKDAGGGALTLAELPDAIKQRAKSAYIQAQGKGPAATQIAGTQTDSVKKQLQQGRQAANETRDMVTPRARAARARALAIHPAAAPFDKPQFNYEFFASVPMGQLELGPAVTAQIAEERNRVQSLRRKDFEARRDQVRRAADRLAVAFGAGNSTFEETYGVVVAPMKSAPTDSDWEALWALNAAAQALDSLAATGDNEPTARENSVEVMAALHRRSGIAFQIPVSKFAAPLRYGETLEQLSERYLGDPNRYGEIVALNGLKAPFIDEVGFDLSLMVNGSADTVVVPTAEVDERLTMGQLVYIWSNAKTRTTRRILSMRVVGAQTAVQVDGDPDMGSYLVADGAKLSSFLPGTVNSQQLVYIPSSSQPADDSFITRSIPGIDEFDKMVQVGGVDLLLDSENDLIVTPDGDTRLAAGLTNVLQSTRVEMGVERGSLLHHKSYGLPIKVGSSSADVTPKELVAAIRRMLQENPAYSRIDQVSVTQNAGALQAAIGVQISGTEQTVPISFSF